MDATGSASQAHPDWQSVNLDTDEANASIDGTDFIEDQTACVIGG